MNNTTIHITLECYICNEPTIQEVSGSYVLCLTCFNYRKEAA